jgi:membrane protein DedA with SNARE-associated domain
MDLAQTRPEILKQLQVDYQAYLKNNGVILPPPDYSPLGQLLKNNWEVLVRQMAGILALAAVLLFTLMAVLVYGLKRWRRRSQSA